MGGGDGLGGGREVKLCVTAAVSLVFDRVDVGERMKLRRMQQRVFRLDGSKPRQRLSSQTGFVDDVDPCERRQ
jgi:hypothetical protein